MARRAGTVVAAVLAVLLGALVLWPDGERVRRLVLDVYLFFLQRGVPPSVTPEHYAAALNVLAFVPLGWLGVALGRRPRTVVLALAAASGLVETLQLLPFLHRDASLLDVACNTAGAAVGALAASAVVGRGGRRLEDAGGEESLDESLDAGRDDRR
jgi:VanZ family protein